MLKPDVLVVCPNQPEQMKVLEQRYTLHRLDLCSDPQAMLHDVGPRIRAVVTSHGGGLTRSLVEQLPKLEIVASSGVGTDSLCIDYCRSRSIKVTNTPDVLTDDVADMGIMLLLATVRRMLPAQRWIEQGDWVSKGAMPFSRSVRGKRLGIVGLGRIGKAVALRAEVFGLEVSYHGRTEQSDVRYPYFPDLLSLAEHVDILLLAVPETGQTSRLITAEVLAALGSEGYLINIARGSVVDETALVDALAQGGLAGAGLDVFANEPHVPLALLQMDKVVLQPHFASATFETRGAMAQLVVDNLEAYFAGKPLISSV